MRIGDYKYNPAPVQLVDPHCVVVIRPWLDVGNVANLAFGELLSLGTNYDLAALAEPGKYYDLTRYRPQIKVSNQNRMIKIPNTVVSAVKTTQKGWQNDLILLNILEPHSFAEQFVLSTIELLREIKIKRYIILGGAYAQVPHTREIPVSGYCRNWSKEPDLKGVSFGTTYSGPTSAVAILTEQVSSSKIPTLSLVASLPSYLKIKDNHIGSARLLEIFGSIYGKDVSFREREKADKLYARLNKVLKNNAEVEKMLLELEQRYDVSSTQKTPKTSLEPSVEKFLEEVLSKEDKGEKEPDPEPGPEGEEL